MSSDRDHARRAAQEPIPMHRTGSMEHRWSPSQTMHPGSTGLTMVRQPSGGMPRVLSAALDREMSGQLPPSVVPIVPARPGSGIPGHALELDPARRTSLSISPLEKVKEAGSGVNLDAYAGDNMGTIKAQTMQALQPPPEASSVPFFVKRINTFGLLLFLLFCAVYVFYFYVRIAYTLQTGYLGYSIFVLVIEFVSSTNMLLYGLLLTRRKAYVEHPVTRRFHVRVLIPCYSESLEIVQATTLAAFRAALPPGCERTVYILDDGKDASKRAWVKNLGEERVIYIPGHIKGENEINGKAHNLNNALGMIYPPGHEIPLEELLCVFDADMVCTAEFFLKTMPRIGDDKVSIVLTPQAFHNYRTDKDIFNHSAFAYWNVMVPGEDAWGHIVCTGSNFLMRARYCMEVGGFPTYTMCEDFALALEFQARGLRSAYVQEYLAVGEVPTTIRGTFQQRSRWCKGGMQIWFSRRNWWIRTDISLLQKIIWSISCWGYLTHSISCPVFLLIPVIGIWLRIFPLENNIWFAAAFTLYFLVMHIMAYWCSDWLTFRSIWFAAINSNNMWFSFLKAWTNVLVSKFTQKQSGFKVTPKSDSIATSTPVKGQKAASPSRRRWRLSPAFRDLWMPMAIFILNLATIGLGIYRLYKESEPSQLETFSLVVSLAWACYNTIPPLLLLHYAAVQNRFLRATIIFSTIWGTLMLLVVILAIWLLLPNTYDFGSALQGSMKFYDTERSGVIPSGYDIPWRGSSALQDSYNGQDLTGGFYDGGNGYIKSVYPIAVSTALLSWGLLEFPKGYERTNQTSKVMDTIRQGTDFLVKCNLGNNQFVVQVGSYADDSTDLNPPEQMTQARPVFLVNATAPGSDIAGSSAAALAAAYMVFQSTESSYAATLLINAKSLYTFATTYPGLVGDSVSEVSNLYFSTSYRDDLAWAAIWLYQATGDSSYLTDAETYKAQSLSDEVDADRNFNVWNYQNSLPGVNLLLARATNFSTANLYTRATEGFLKVWMMGWLTIRYTPHLLAYTPDAPLRNSANAAFLAMMYAKHRPAKYDCWAESQARYFMGSSGRSFMVGLGHKPPVRSYDKVAMCSTNNGAGYCLAVTSGQANPHVNTGAMVDGPDISDGYNDERSYMSMAGVHLDNNAGLSGLLAGLEQLDINWASCTAGVNFVKMKIQGRPI